MFQQPLQIGNLSIPNRVILAPLAGVSDIPFRRICQEHDAGLTYVEMLSAVAINRQSERTFGMMARHADESILGVQVTGPTPKEIADSVKLFDREGFETMDINMGCPVRKVVNKGWGSAMLLDPQRVEDTVKACKDVTDRPLTAKIRLGYTRNTLNVEDICERIHRAGADMVTVHGRCRSESYNRPVDRKGIRTGFRATGDGIVHVANGDVMDFASAQAMAVETECDAVMVSRGALGNPWVFQQILGGHDVHPCLRDWLEVVLRHADYHEEFYGRSLGATARFRKHLLWYVAGFPSCRPMRSKLSTVTEMVDVRRHLIEWAEGLDPETIRFSTDRKPAADHDPKYEMDRSLDRGVGDDEGQVSPHDPPAT